MKYIVEFEDEPCMYEDDVHFYKCIQAPWWGLSERVIKRLTPYQPEPDCVSRKTALDAFGLSEKTRKYDGDHSGYDTRMLYEIQDTLEDLPAVQPERKPGRWKEHIFEGIMGGRPRALMCNQCNSLSLHATNFCPNCGADMRGGDSNE